MNKSVEMNLDTIIGLGLKIIIQYRIFIPLPDPIFAVTDIPRI
jgi:hypothetical protein